jgi:predicted neuraminidase
LYKSIEPILFNNLTGKKMESQSVIIPDKPVAKIDNTATQGKHFSSNIPMFKMGEIKTAGLLPLAFAGIPTIERVNEKTMLVAWYGGGNGEQSGNYLIMSKSNDGGTNWSEAKPFLIAADPEYRVFDPCLWKSPNGKLFLFWALARTLSKEMNCFYCQAEVNSKTEIKWGNPKRIGSGVALNKPTVRWDGVWLLPVGDWGEKSELAEKKTDRSSSQVYISYNEGKSFEYLGCAKVKECNCDEHMLTIEENKQLRMFVRTRYGIGESFSQDGGKTWSKGTPSDIYGCSSRFFIQRMPSGRLLMINHAPPTIDSMTPQLKDKYDRSWYLRTRLTAFLSEDNGKSWPYQLMLDDRQLVSYPDGTVSEGGTINVVYDYDRYYDTEIILAQFDEADIINKVAPSKNIVWKRSVMP